MGIKPKIKVIINADDFGYSCHVNDAVAEALSMGCISSATIIANGLAVDGALSLTTHFPAASFGAHLNLTEFKPLLPVHELDSTGLINADGYFLGSDSFRKLRPSPHLMAACYREFEQQIQYLLGKGLALSHLDSHHHIHTVPWLLPVIYSLQRKYKICRLRTTMNIYRSDVNMLPSKKLFFAKRFWELFSSALGFVMPQRFTSLQIFMDNPSRSEFTTAKSIELMCHPGQNGFEAETNQLLSSGREVLPNNFQLIPYWLI